MSFDPLPKRLAARKICQREGRINSIASVDEMPRFAEFLHDDRGQAEITLKFGVDDSGQLTLHGTLGAEVNMTCQRCLEGTGIIVQTSLAVRIAENEHEAQEMDKVAQDPQEKLETLICEDGELDVRSLIEDELIMALPIVARHSDQHCNELLNALRAGDIESTNTNSAGRATIPELEALEKLKQQLAK